MEQRKLKTTAALVTVTAVWGLTFTLIKSAVQRIPPLTFVTIRFLLASLILGAWVFLLQPEGRRKPSGEEWRAGGLLGIFLFLGYAFQTVGLQFTTAVNAGFITGISVVLVPIISLYTDSPTLKGSSWVAVALSTLGLALLCLSDGLHLNSGDGLILFCALGFALHIVYVGKYSGRLDPARLTWIQITVCGVLSFLGSTLGEHSTLSELSSSLGRGDVAGSLLFCSVVATALAFFAQNHFQRYSTPVKTALIFTCEPVFSAFFGTCIGGETLSFRQFAGCGLLLSGMALAELGGFLQIRSVTNGECSATSNETSRGRAGL